mmetsp:Transcript_10217/g.23724  ORF Transcript_10217/g.23724 Transcript_10217/m.23724 type:complete len:304 (+) Transcript_10217:939-1850(+)
MLQPLCPSWAAHCRTCGNKKGQGVRTGCCGSRPSSYRCCCERTRTRRRRTQGGGVVRDPAQLFREGHVDLHLLGEGHSLLHGAQRTRPKVRQVLPAHTRAGDTLARSTGLCDDDLPKLPRVCTRNLSNRHGQHARRDWHVLPEPSRVRDHCQAGIRRHVGVPGHWLEHFQHPVRPRHQLVFPGNRGKLPVRPTLAHYRMVPRLLHAHRLPALVPARGGLRVHRGAGLHPRHVPRRLRLPRAHDRGAHLHQGQVHQVQRHHLLGVVLAVAVLPDPRELQRDEAHLRRGRHLRLTPRRSGSAAPR